MQTDFIARSPVQFPTAHRCSEYEANKHSLIHLQGLRVAEPCFAQAPRVLAGSYAYCETRELNESVKS